MCTFSTLNQDTQNCKHVFIFIFLLHRPLFFSSRADILLRSFAVFSSVREIHTGERRSRGKLVCCYTDYVCITFNQKIMLQMIRDYQGLSCLSVQFCWEQEKPVHQENKSCWKQPFCSLFPVTVSGYLSHYYIIIIIWVWNDIGSFFVICFLLELFVSMEQNYFISRLVAHINILTVSSAAS